MTELCRFRTNDDSVATVDSAGLISSSGPGDSHIIVFYDNGVGAVPVLRPTANRKFQAAGIDPDASMIDQFVIGKLNKLGISPFARSAAMPNSFAASASI